MGSNLRPLGRLRLLSVMKWTMTVTLLLGISTITPVEASISLLKSGKTFSSKLDTKLGQPLLRGMDYMGRLQYVVDNPTLCPGEYPHQKFDVVTPADGLPIALVAMSGGCSILDKVMVASSMINPANTVGYLIIQDASKRHILTHAQEEGDMNRMGGLSLFGLSQQQQQLQLDTDTEESMGVLVVDDVQLDLARGNGRALLENHYLPEEYAQPRTDPNAPLQAVNIAVLHVSYGTGQALWTDLLQESTFERRQGGLQVLLNGNENSFATRTLIFWMLVTVSVCACGCACLLVCFQHALEDVEPSENEAPRRPVRRRLTLEEVRARFPSYHFDADDGNCCPHPPTDAGGGGMCDDAGVGDGVGVDVGDHHQNHYMQLLDECTICLDEFTPGVRVRKLPCGHVFHSTCIARWLIERSAVCPLCKLDLYVEPEEDDESSSSSSSSSSGGGNRNERPLDSWGLWSSGWGWVGGETNATNTNTNTNNNQNNNEGYTPLLVPSGSAETAPVVGDEAPEQQRSWWPFSLETAPEPSEDAPEDHDPSHRPRRRRLPLSAVGAANVVSHWTRSLLGRSSRRRHVDTSIDNNNTNLTELTEPLVSSSAAGSGEMEILHNDATSNSPSSSSTAANTNAHAASMGLAESTNPNTAAEL